MEKLITYYLFIIRSYLSTNRMIKNIFYLFFLSSLFFCPLSFAISDQTIIEIIRSGDEAAVNKLIQDNDLEVNQVLQVEKTECKIWEVVNNKYTPLMVAAKSGLIKIVKNLIEQGAEIDKQVNKMTALMHAVA